MPSSRSPFAGSRQSRGRMSEGNVQGVLLTGIFGVGKSTVAAEMAEMLEERQVRYAALDMDWLTWAYSADHDEGAEHRMMLINLSSVVANYLAAGIERFILARTIRTQGEMVSLRGALPFPLTSVRLTCPLPEIRRRASSDVTTARQADLREAADMIASAEGDGLEDLSIANEGRSPRWRATYSAD